MSPRNGAGGFFGTPGAAGESLSPAALFCIGNSDCIARSCRKCAKAHKSARNTPTGVKYLPEKRRAGTVFAGAELTLSASADIIKSNKKTAAARDKPSKKLRCGTGRRQLAPPRATARRVSFPLRLTVGRRRGMACAQAKKRRQVASRKARAEAATHRHAAAQTRLQTPCPAE